MGGTLAGIFSNQGQGDKGAPSFLQKLVQGTAKGAGGAFGKSMQAPPGGPGGGGLPAAPAPAPVDPRYFMPTAMNSNPNLQPGTATSSAFYG